MFDIVIIGGRIMDGSGSPWYYGDIGINGDRITAIGKLDQAKTKKSITANGQIICPGFIDTHSHSDVMLLANPKHEPKIMQGVTTDLLGLDGLSYAPLSTANLNMVRHYIAGLNGNPDISWNWSSVSEYLSLFKKGITVNVAYLVPHNALRLEAMGFVDRIPTIQEMSNMQQILANGIREGAVGFSTGLDYYPARYSNTNELISLCEVVAEYNVISVWHLRTRDIGLFEAAKEAVEVATKTGAKVHFSHYAANNPPMWGRSVEMLALVDEARDKGLDITFDSYPYVATSTTLIIFLPRWVHEGGPDNILARLGQPETKDKICADLRAASYNWKLFVLTSVVTEKNRIYLGQNIAEAANVADKEVEEFVCDLLLEESLAVSYAGFTGNEEDIQTIMKHPCHTACSDGLLIGEKPNPRGWGTFARYLGFYGRELGVLSLEEAIRHMTAAPAQRLGLNDRGLVKVGLSADIAVFDPQRIIDKATFNQPKQYPAGINYVLVNGAVVVDKGKHTGVLNGHALLRKVNS